MITNTHSGTNIQEIASGIFRINTPVDLPGGMPFSFNQYLVMDEEPLLFHTGKRGMFRLVGEAVARVTALDNLRHLAFSHFEADECGALNDFLEAAPNAAPVCGRLAAAVSVNDFARRPARALADGETLVLGERVLRWIDTPHLPHGWESGLLMDTTSGTLFCGDLFTQVGHGAAPMTEGDIMGPSEAMREKMDYYTHTPRTRELLQRLAEERPNTLACMHGSAWRGDGAALLRDLAATLCAEHAFA